ncbi:NAD(P)H-dependent oxidoreductase [Glycomyces sp. NPDC046736]|uniref:NAD(P)H-dependent oxidoreductase n=1 Tax=Glycomyces sp. NPDC046736 TaxID=3155615 RepID=UPI0033DE84A1
MRTHLVYAHPHHGSLNASLRDEAVQTLEGLGHTVTVSDLYAMKWKAVADFDDYGPTEADSFINASAQAWDEGTLSADILAEQEKLLAADNLILQFPLWWFSMPAIMKGWMDRVFTNGFGYGTSRDWKRYGEGRLEGKRAMIVVTTGAADTHLSARGINGAIDDLLFPIQHGILFYTGMEVLPPLALTGAGWNPDYEGMTKRLRERLETLAETAPIAYRHQSTDYDEDKLLLPGLEPEGTTGFALHTA